MTTATITDIHELPLMTKDDYVRIRWVAFSRLTAQQKIGAAKMFNAAGKEGLWKDKYMWAFPVLDGNVRQDYPVLHNAYEFRYPNHRIDRFFEAGGGVGC